MSSLQIVRMRLRIPPTNAAGKKTRWHEATNAIQFQALDGSWVDDPTLDPRYDPQYRLPLRTGSNKPCLSAYNAVYQFKLMVDAWQAGFSGLGLANSSIAISFLFMPAVNIVVEAVTAVSGLILSIGSVAIATSFDEPCYEAMRCALSCAADDDGQWSKARMDDALYQLSIDADVDTIAESIISAVFNLIWGNVGLSNAGTMTDVTTADCDSCGCRWEKTWDFTVSSELPAGATLYNMVWVSGLGYTVTSENTPGHYDGSVRIPILATYGMLHAASNQYAVGSGACAWILGFNGTNAGGFSCSGGILTLDNIFTVDSDLVAYVGSLAPGSTVQGITQSGEGTNPYTS